MKLPDVTPRLCGIVVLLAATLLLPPVPVFAQAPGERAVPAIAQPAAAPAAAQPAMAPTPSPDAVLKLPRDLSPWGMFMAADVVVKAVMIGLAFASVLTWTIWLAKVIELIAARRRLRTAIAALNKARNWSEASAGLSGRRNGVATLVAAADAELRQSAGALLPDGVKERIASRLERAEAGAGRAMIRGTGILATVGATAPFVGLFGTVWGIMNSFIGISKVQTTNLAVVAPGIAEALFATAIGLFAAIPALIAYNKLQSDVVKSQGRMETFADEFSAILSRQIDQTAGRDRAA